MDSPRVRVPPRGAVESDVEDAVFLSSSYGLTPDLWQEDICEDWLGRNKRGKWAASTCWLAVPRQNGKNGAIEVRELYGMVVLGEKFLHTAHEVKTARKAFKRLKHFFGERVNDPNAKYPELNALVVELRSTNGQEAIILANGGSIEFVARSKGSGRGFTVDVLVLDEAQDLTDDEFEALRPTISAAPLRNPQIILTGTPPNTEKNPHAGEVFARLRRKGLDGTSKRMTMTDFGCPDGPLPDIDDKAMLRATNPGLETGRLQMDVIEGEREDLSPEGFARERFGWWGDPDVASGSAFGEGRWEACLVEGLGVPNDIAAIGVAVSIDRDRASIGVAGVDGDVLEVGAFKQQDGTGWLVPECLRIQTRYRCAVAIDTKGPAADLIPALEAAGVELTKAGTADVLDATASLFDRVRDKLIRHGGHAWLEQAVKAAKKRDVQDRWTFGRRKSTGDISMLEGVNLAAWAAEQDTNYDIADSYLGSGG